MYFLLNIQVHLSFDHEENCNYYFRALQKSIFKKIVIQWGICNKIPDYFILCKLVRTLNKMCVASSQIRFFN